MRVDQAANVRERQNMIIRAHTAGMKSQRQVRNRGNALSAILRYMLRADQEVDVVLVSDTVIVLNINGINTKRSRGIK